LILQNKFYKKNNKIKSIGKDGEKLEHLNIVGENVKWYSHCGKQYGTPSKKNKK
jgi:hypothetical protein